MSCLPYDQRAADLLRTWTAAIDHVLAIVEAAQALPAAEARRLDAQLERATAARQAAKLAYDQHKQCTPTPAALTAAFEAANRQSGAAWFVARMEGSSNALAA